MSKLIHVLALFLAISAVLARPVRADVALPDFSGMATVGPAAYLVVADVKAEKGGPRLGVLQVADGKCQVEPVTVDWGEGAEPANDLEACCALPGRPGTFLLAESGFWRGRFGRVLQIQLKEAQGVWTARVTGSLQPFPRSSPTASTPDADQIEGMAVLVRPNGRKVLVFGHRGSRKAAGLIEWGDLDDSGFHSLGTQPLDLRDSLLERSCGDLVAVQSGTDWRVFSVATRDPGDMGPFASAVYEVGRFTADDKSVRYQPLTTPRPVARLDGLKVEALGIAPTALAPRAFCVGTDDERFAPIWRIVPGHW